MGTPLLVKEDDGPTEQPVETKYGTNRFKAIVAMNIYAILIVLEVVAIKKTVNEKKVNVFDLILILNCFSIVVTALGVPLLGDSFTIPKETRCIFFSRAFNGFLLTTCFFVGGTLVSITV